MTITPALIGPVRTALINATGREHPLCALFHHAEPALYAGVIEVDGEFVPFTVGQDRQDDLTIWDDDVANSMAAALYTLFDIISDFRYGNRKNPHK